MLGTLLMFNDWEPSREYLMQCICQDGINFSQLRRSLVAWGRVDNSVYQIALAHTGAQYQLCVHTANSARDRQSKLAELSSIWKSAGVQSRFVTLYLVESAESVKRMFNVPDAITVYQREDLSTDLSWSNQ